MKNLSNKQPVTKKDLNKALEEHSKVIIGAVNYGFEENKKEHQKFEAKINKTHNLIDSYVKAQEDFKEEFTMLKSEVAKIKKVIKEKLGIEIRAL